MTHALLFLQYISLYGYHLDTLMQFNSTFGWNQVIIFIIQVVFRLGFCNPNLIQGRFGQSKHDICILSNMVVLILLFFFFLKKKIPNSNYMMYYFTLLQRYIHGFMFLLFYYFILINMVQFTILILIQIYKKKILKILH